MHYGAAVLEQLGAFAWQVFDLLYAEYRVHDAHFVEADTLPLMTGVDGHAATATLTVHIDAVKG